MTECSGSSNISNNRHRRSCSLFVCPLGGSCCSWCVYISIISACGDPGSGPPTTSSATTPGTPHIPSSHTCTHTHIYTHTTVRRHTPPTHPPTHPLTHFTPQIALATAPNCLYSRYQSPAAEHFGWRHSPSSRCFPVTWLMATQTYQFPSSNSKEGWRDAMCYPSSCTPQGKLQLDIMGKKVDCPSGSTLNLASLLPGTFTRGSIGPCPDNAAMCASLACGDACAVGGLCVAGRCYCDLAFTGPDCGKKLTPDGSYSAYTPVAPGGEGGAGGAGGLEAGFLMVRAAVTEECGV